MYCKNETAPVMPVNGTMDLTHSGFKYGPKCLNFGKEFKDGTCPGMTYKIQNENLITFTYNGGPSNSYTQLFMAAHFTAPVTLIVSGSIR